MIYPNNNNDCIANDARATMITTSISFQNIAIIPKKPILCILNKHNATTVYFTLSILCDNVLFGADIVQYTFSF